MNGKSAEGTWNIPPPVHPTFLRGTLCRRCYRPMTFTQDNFPSSISTQQNIPPFCATYMDTILSKYQQASRIQLPPNSFFPPYYNDHFELPHSSFPPPQIPQHTNPRKHHSHEGMQAAWEKAHATTDGLCSQSLQVIKDPPFVVSENQQNELDRMNQMAQKESQTLQDSSDTEKMWNLDIQLWNDGQVPMEQEKPYVEKIKVAWNRKLASRNSKHHKKQLNAPLTLIEPMLSLFKKQESARQLLRHQHRVERERLILCCEKEILRLHVRDTGISFLSAARVLRDTEVYNPLQLEKVKNKLFKRAGNSSNCEIANSSLEDALETIKLQFGKKKIQLINRQRMEAQSLQASQQMTWEAQLKKTTQPLKTNAVSVPSVQILEDFDLLPSVSAGSG